MTTSQNHGGPPSGRRGLWAARAGRLRPPAAAAHFAGAVGEVAEEFGVHDLAHLLLAPRFIDLDLELLHLRDQALLARLDLAHHGLDDLGKLRDLIAQEAPPQKGEVLAVVA